jgi:predicted DsbA family dithiol-disulfide isomerase
VVRIHFPEHFEALDESLYRAHWVDGLDIGDRAVIDRLVQEAGASPTEVFDLVADGVGHDLVQASIADARDHGVVSTPSWWVDDALLIPGAPPRDTIERWIGKLLTKRGG